MVILKFEEQQHTVLYHDYKVFIFGSDVTPYVEGAININYADRDGFNSITFALTNALQQFEITPENIADPSNKNKGWRMDSGARYSEQAKFEIFTKKNDPTLNPYANLNTLTSAGGGIGGATSDLGATSQVRRWPLGPYQLIFNKLDQIRVFIHNPYTESDEWIWGFSGFLDTKTFDTNYLNGQSTIKIQAQDIRLLMKKMRVALNPYISTNLVVEKVFAGKGASSYFNDLMLGDVAPQLGHPFANVGYLDAMATLIAGKVITRGAEGKPITTPTGDVTDTNDRGTAVGQMKVGSYIEYDYTNKATAQKTLDTWNHLCLFGGESGWLTESRVNEIGKGTYESGDYDITNSKIHFLAPKTGTPNNTLIELGVDGAQNANYEWTSRYDLVLQITKNIDYQFAVAANGDFLFEFPMYDFFPKSFSKMWENIYTVDMHVERDDIDDEGGEAVAALAVDSKQLRKEISTQDSHTPGSAATQNTSQYRVLIFSDILASRVGAITETHTIPGITDNGRLESLGKIEFMKRNADFNKFTLDFTYRLFIRPNRPIYHKTKERMGITSSYALTLNTHQECSNQATLRLVRLQEQDGTFRFVTGSAAAPISYSTLYNASVDEGAVKTNIVQGSDEKDNQPQPTSAKDQVH